MQLTHVFEAMQHLSPVVHQTPLERSATFDAMTGSHLYFKMENLQRTGSFKLRGALNKISHLSAEDAAKGVIAASAGNHAQGVALSASKRGIKAKIFMPAGTPKAKVLATEAYGAEAVLIGESYQEAYEAAVQDQLLNGSTFVHAFDDFEVMAGQGTIALEMVRQYPDLDMVIVPIGGGGLAAGIATFIKNVNPSIRVIGVQEVGAAAVYNRFHHVGETRLKHVSGIADGILVKEAGRLTYPIIEKYVDDIVTVTDADVARAMILMLERAKMFVEGAGAAAFAAALAGQVDIRGKHVGIVVSGGNADLEKLPLYKKMISSVDAIKSIG